LLNLASGFLLGALISALFGFTGTSESLGSVARLSFNFFLGLFLLCAYLAVVKRVPH